MRFDIVQEMPKRARDSKYAEYFDGQIRRAKLDAKRAQQVAAAMRQSAAIRGHRLATRYVDGCLYVQAVGPIRKRRKSKSAD